MPEEEGRAGADIGPYPPQVESGSSTARPSGRAGRAAKLVLIGALIAVVTVLHYGTSAQAGAAHDILMRSYYIPIVLAALWFGGWGGFLAALTVTVVYLPHALRGWNAPYSEVFRLIEILMYYVIGVLTGLLSSRTRTALAAERTARIEREEALEEKGRAYDVLKERTTQVLDLERQIRRSDRLAALGKLSAGLAHEIRNPLGSIKTAVEILAEREALSLAAAAEETADLYRVILEETERLDRTLTAFLDFARSERHGDGAVPRHSDLASAVRHTVELLDAQLERRRIPILWDAAALHLEVAVSDGHLRQVLLNLVLNAMDAMEGGGEVRIRVMDHSRREVLVAVEDEGPGVPPELGDTIFDPFVSTKAGGTGLGLAVVARLLDSYGGSVDLDRDYVPGARFLIRLPVFEGGPWAAPS